MKRIATLALSLCLCASAYGQEVSRPCNKAATFKHDLATGPIEIIPAQAGKRIYYCGFTAIQRGQTLDLIIMAGQGVNCAVNTAPITPQFEFPADTVFSTRSENGQPVVAAGYALCVQTLGNGKLAGIVYYSQF